MLSRDDKAKALRVNKADLNGSHNTELLLLYLNLSPELFEFYKEGPQGIPKVTDQPFMSTFFNQRGSSGLRINQRDSKVSDQIK